METIKLAKQLRRRLILQGDPSGEKSNQEWKTIVMSIDDDDVVMSYINCPCCGENLVTEAQLERIIDLSNDANEFVDMVDQVGEFNMTIPLMIKAKLLDQQGVDFKYLFNEN